jgi:hypothetical protein
MMVSKTMPAIFLRLAPRRGGRPVRYFTRRPPE